MSLNQTSFLLRKDSILGFGRNNNGQVGNGSTIAKSGLTQLSIDGIDKVSVSGTHSAILMKDGTVKSAGENRYGQLANGNTVPQKTFVDSTAVPVGVVDVFAGNYNTYYLTNDGAMYAVGLNNYGQLGTNDKTNYLTPQKLSLHNVKNMATGTYHAAFVLKDGTLYTVGYNYYGQLGLNSTTDYLAPGKTSISDAIQVSCGTSHTVVLKSDGTVVVAGLGTSGQLGTGEKVKEKFFTKVNISDVKFVSCGALHTLFLKNDGTVWSCGNGSLGRTGLASGENEYSPKKIELENVISISAGYDYSLFLTKDKEVYACGNNAYYQIKEDDVNTQFLMPTLLDIEGVTGLPDCPFKASLNKFLLENSGYLYTINETNELVVLGLMGGDERVTALEEQGFEDFDEEKQNILKQSDPSKFKVLTN